MAGSICLALLAASTVAAQSQGGAGRDWWSLHATILHLLGIDHERLTFYHNGIQRRLTNVAGNVLTDLLA